MARAAFNLAAAICIAYAMTQAVQAFVGHTLIWTCEDNVKPQSRELGI